MVAIVERGGDVERVPIAYRDAFNNAYLTQRESRAFQSIPNSSHPFVVDPKIQ